MSGYEGVFVAALSATKVVSENTCSTVPATISKNFF